MEQTMIIRNAVFALTLAGLVVACGGPGEQADVPVAQPAEATSADIGDHIVHFNAQSTDALTLETAQALSIRRSKDSAMLNISVIAKADGSSVGADVNVKAVNLTGQLKDMTMRRVDDAGAIYYIGTTSVANRETLVFDITVRPEGAAAASEVRFKRQFYSD